MRKAIIFSTLLASATLSINGQNVDDFRRERLRMLADYNAFRDDILNNYAKFLAEAWDNYKLMRGEKRYPDKKPYITPNAPDEGKTPLTVPDKTPLSAPKGTLPEPIMPQEPIPAPTQSPQVEPTTIDPMTEKIDFPFYGIRMKAAKVEVRQLASVNEKDVSACWARMQHDGIYEKAAPSLKLLATGAGMSDWLMFVLVRQYADAVCHGEKNTATVFSHYLLANMGYDVRLGKAGNEMALLVAFRQMVYTRPYFILDGKKYFLFLDDNGPLKRQVANVSTCTIPTGADLGKPLNLVLTAPKVCTGKNIQFENTGNGISVSGTVDNIAKRIADEFPQTEIPVYAASCLQKDFREKLLAQVGEQVKGMAERDAANTILQFVQLAFKYKTDDEQFGYEKSFFVEENFIYPANDCEDRAILYAFLVKNILHLDVHLLYYPNHEATAVAFSDQSANGDGYDYKGKRFTICDPTYIGASVGECMPQYKSVKPKIQ